MQILLRIIVLLTIALLGGLCFSLAVNVIVMMGIVDVDNVKGGFGYEMTSKAVMVWIGSVMLGIISLFLQQKWRYVLLLSPLICACPVRYIIRAKL